MANLCSNCGSELADDATVCESCGVAVETVEMVEPVQENEIVENEETTAKDGFIARMKMFAQKPLFLAALILYAGGMMLTYIVSAFMLWPIIKIGIEGKVLTIIYLLFFAFYSFIFWTLWRVYQEAKNKESVKRTLMSLTVFKVITIIAIVLLSIYTLIVAFYLIVFSLIKIDIAINISLIAIVVILFVAYIYTYLISALITISSIRKGIKTNLIQPISGSGVLSFCMYIISIIRVLIILVVLAYIVLALNTPMINMTGNIFGMLSLKDLLQGNLILIPVSITSYIGMFLFAMLLRRFNKSLKNSLKD